MCDSSILMPVRFSFLLFLVVLVLSFTNVMVFLELNSKVSSSHDELNAKIRSLALTNAEQALTIKTMEKNIRRLEEAIGKKSEDIKHLTEKTESASWKIMKLEFHTNFLRSKLNQGQEKPRTQLRVNLGVLEKLIGTMKDCRSLSQFVREDFYPFITTLRLPLHGKVIALLPLLVLIGHKLYSANYISGGKAKTHVHSSYISFPSWGANWNRVAKSKLL